MNGVVAWRTDHEVPSCAPTRAALGDRLLAIATGRDQDYPAVGEDLLFCRRSGVLPNRAVSGFLPSRSTLASKRRCSGRHGMAMAGLRFRHHAAVLGGEDLEHRGQRLPARLRQRGLYWVPELVGHIALRVDGVSG